MDKNKRFPYFTKNQQKGIITLALIIISIQLAYFFYKSNSLSDPENNFTASETLWLQNQLKLDSLKLSKPDSTYKLHPFNPNFITDFKGYQLGMSVDEIDRLHNFRKLNKYVNSPEEFQSVTKISDSLLLSIQGYFKFPDWVTNSKNKNYKNSYTDFNSKSEKKNIEIKDLNSATLSDFILLPGIGETFASRIITEREKYNGFASLNQLNDVWGLTPEAVKSVTKYFVIKNTSQLIKVNINNASVSEIAKLPYIRYNLAREIVIYRSKYGDFKSVNDLNLVKDFPSDKSEIINAYLQF